MVSKCLQFSRRLLKILFCSPKDLRYVIAVANYAAGEICNPAADIRSIPEIEIADIDQKSSRWIVQLFPKVGASVAPMECNALAALVRLVNAKRVFEFGTYKGVSTTQLALNVADNGVVFTLDLPEDDSRYALPIIRAEERLIAAESNKGVLVPEDVRPRVIFLRHDSATFDETPYLGAIDLVFVDGAHSYEYVKNDSEKGWNMLRPGGVLAWHDFVPSHPDVVRFVRECGWKPKRVTQTALAYAIRPIA